MVRGGQKQLVALARALYHKPSLLLLDEPTATMDIATEQFVLRLLEKVKTTTAILMITHRNSTLPAADAIYRLEKGICYDVSEKVFQH